MKDNIPSSSPKKEKEFEESVVGINTSNKKEPYCLFWKKKRSNEEKDRKKSWIN